MNADESSDLSNLCFILGSMNTNPTDDSDGLIFTLNPDGKYTVCTFRKLIDSKIASPSDKPRINWSKVVPLKIRYFIWRDIHNKIPVASNLAARGVKLQSTLCPL